MSSNCAIPACTIPTCTWSRPLGLPWNDPYRVRYGSNLDDGPWHGMPLGGLGAGCIGRSPRGEFNLWHIDGGEHWFEAMPACQFSLFEQTAERSQAYTLAPAEDAFTWSPYPGVAPEDRHDTGHYHALYPRSWFTYEQVFETQITCEQFSPVLPHNYQDTSYPVAVFLWTLHNPGPQPVTLSILLSWENVAGWFTNTLASPEVTVRDDGSPVYVYQPRLRESAGNANRWVSEGNSRGCVMGQTRSGAPREGDGEWAIATLINPSDSADLEVFYHSRWNPAGDGSDLWRTFAKDGSLPNVSDPSPADAGERVGAALAVRVTLQPGERRQIPVALAWDFPVTEFAAGVQTHRRYTDFFGSSGQSAWAIACTALEQYSQWRSQIEAWQQPVIDRSDLPDWFKMALFNELYDLASGGSLWSSASDGNPEGQFAVLECLDYRWYESLDVRLYGSFALLMLFPKLDKAILRAFAKAIPATDLRTRTIGYYMTIGKASPAAQRKLPGATPHDLGAPNEYPWEQTNYTSYQDCNQWKDLASDFVLQVYRDFYLTGSTDDDFLLTCWEAIVAALDYLKRFDHDGDGIPENSGAPDQTFDDWQLDGVSAYCGGLWLVALQAAIAVGQRLQSSGLGDRGEIEGAILRWQRWFAQAQPLYQSRLWNGQYYQLDTGSGSDVVMADQLCGQFYARLLGLPDIVPADCAATALDTIYQTCFLRFADGKLGAANGLRPDGSPANPNDTHPLEVWTGINFGLAAFLLQMEQPERALALTEAVVRQIYDHGLQFRTPEAITAEKTFRACHYLRAMAIWLVYGVWTDFK
ncbi:MAG: GH116 family glycosyl hydrolase [Elainellaceae cyanobacterium]